MMPHNPRKEFFLIKITGGNEDAGAKRGSFLAMSLHNDKFSFLFLAKIIILCLNLISFNVDQLASDKSLNSCAIYLCPEIIVSFSPSPYDLGKMKQEGKKQKKKKTI